MWSVYPSLCISRNRSILGVVVVIESVLVASAAVAQCGAAVAAAVIDLGARD